MDSNQIFCICLDISYSYFYILHIVDEIVVASFGSAVACGCFVDGSFVEVDLTVAVVVTMRLDIDVTSSWCRPTDDILSFDSTNPDLKQRQRVNWARD